MQKDNIENKDGLVYWGIPNFHETTKNRFMGECKKRGKKPRVLLAHLMKRWMFEMKKEDNI